MANIARFLRIMLSKDEYMQATHSARVVSSHLVSKGILLIDFQLIEPAQVNFKAGQYLAVFLPNSDKQSYYSIASSPNKKNSLELLVKEDKLGEGASYLFALEEGDEVQFEMPMGEAFLRDEHSSNIVFVAGASGASYIRSMIHYLDEVDQLKGREIHYFLGAREEDELLEVSYMHKLAAKYKGFHFIPALSDQDNWDGQSGLITEVVERLMPDDLSGWDAYSAGSPGMVEAVAKTLINNKCLQPKNFYSDFYNPK